MHERKVTAWCLLWSGGVTRTYFLENDEGQKETVYVERYRGIKTDYFWHEIEHIEMEDMRFHQDGETCHTCLQL